MTSKQKYRNEDTQKRWESHGDIPIYRVMILADMAMNGEYPDGTFGDDEVIIWEQFRSMRFIPVNP